MKRADDPHFVGHATLSDGTHIPLTAADAKAFWDCAEGQRIARQEAMPTETDALRQFHQAYTRLKELGWMEPCYATYRGECDIISLGCSAIHRAAYSGEWPTGDWWLRDDMDTIEPALAKPIEEEQKHD